MTSALASPEWSRAEERFAPVFPDFDPSQIPMAAPIAAEKLVYLLDPVGASRRSLPLRTRGPPSADFETSCCRFATARWRFPGFQAFCVSTTASYFRSASSPSGLPDR